VFDNDPTSTPRALRPSPAVERPGPEDERIALRCNRKELQLLDSFVASGEFGSRSELMREALREFLRARAASGAMLAGEGETVPVSLRLRRDELESYATYARLVADGASVPSVLASLVRRGALEAKVAELVANARHSVERSAERRQQIEGLTRSGEELARRGVVGR
jgi:Arc/MetJ-type ribon-helix-helix transcriptional regulator